MFLSICIVGQEPHSVCSSVCRTGWTRCVVEKPFGKDSETSRQLSQELAQHLREDQIYRIDHYLGKELIENLTVSTRPFLCISDLLLESSRV